MGHVIGFKIDKNKYNGRANKRFSKNLFNHLRVNKMYCVANSMTNLLGIRKS
jgi:hypothetical protein